MRQVDAIIGAYIRDTVCSLRRQWRYLAVPAHDKSSVTSGLSVFFFRCRDLSTTLQKSSIPQLNVQTNFVTIGICASEPMGCEGSKDESRGVDADKPAHRQSSVGGVVFEALRCWLNCVSNLIPHPVTNPHRLWKMRRPPRRIPLCKNCGRSRATGYVRTVRRQTRSGPLVPLGHSSASPALEFTAA